MSASNFRLDVKADHAWTRRWLTRWGLVRPENLGASKIGDLDPHVVIEQDAAISPSPGKPTETYFSGLRSR